MKSLLEITTSILLDCGMLCGVDPSRDCLTVTRRFEDEGESFLTISLPTLASGLEKALDQGYWSPALATSFGCKRSLPRFLGGFFDQVFDQKGAVRQLTREVTQSIWAIRQICRVVSKLYLPAKKVRVLSTLSKFVDVEKEVHDHVVPEIHKAAFVAASRIIWADIVSTGGNSCSLWDDLKPHHGRGTTAEGIRGNSKFRFASWPSRLDRHLPYSEFGVSSLHNPGVEDAVQSIVYTLPRDETPVKVCAVPKTARGPRIIAIEPVAMQYMQQSLASWVIPRIERLGTFTSGRVNFSDQRVNSQLACLASSKLHYATLDLSDASDRVSCRLVNLMLSGVPDFRRYVMACRSTRAYLPSGKTIPLYKFASMGSAMCFPMEAMVFFISIVSGRMLRSGIKHPTGREMRRLSRGIYVYGDDLIVPTSEAPSVVKDLEAFGLKVNAAKSFWTGKFRESCGGDFYGGVDVKPVYLRREIPYHRADVKGIVASVDFANQLYFAGLWKTAQLVRSEIEEILGPMPSVTTNDQVLGWKSFSNARSFTGWHADYQRPKVRGYIVHATKRLDPLQDDAALLKCLALIGNDNEANHLLTSVKSGNLTLKRRWT